MLKKERLLVHLLVDKVEEHGHQDIGNGHKVHDAVIDTFGNRGILLAFKYGPTHSALCIGENGKKKDNGHNKIIGQKK